MTAARRARVSGIRRVGDSRSEGHPRTFTDRFALVERREAAQERYRLVVEGERAAVEEEATAAAEPFGLDWKTLDYLALDTLTWVTREGEHWRWHGRMSNHGVAVVRLRKVDGADANTEWTAPRILHRLLVPGHENPPNMRQRCDAPFVCVRPEHRCRWCKVNDTKGDGT